MYLFMYASTGTGPWEEAQLTCTSTLAVWVEYGTLPVTYLSAEIPLVVAACAVRYVVKENACWKKWALA